MAYDPSQLYVTGVEQEAYNLAGQCLLAQVRTRTDCHSTKYGQPYWVVVMEAPEAYDRGRTVRQQMFGS
jgi:hypothetical protein